MFSCSPHFAHIRCTETDCGPHCPFKHEGETDTSKDPYYHEKPSKSYEELSRLVDIELAKYNPSRYAPSDVSMNNSVNYSENTNHNVSILEPNSTTTIPIEDSHSTDAEFSEEETEEEKAAREDKHNKYMAAFSKSRSNKAEEEVSRLSIT